MAAAVMVVAEVVKLARGGSIKVAVVMLEPVGVVWGGPKKVNLVLDQLERCGFLHGVQHVSKNTSIVILDIAKF